MMSLLAPAASAATLVQAQTAVALHSQPGGQVVGVHEPKLRGESRQRAPSSYDQVAVGSCVAPETEGNSVAEDIANGHAYDKHVVEQGEYPEITTRGQFQQVIQNTIDNATEEKLLSGGRYAYWYGNDGTVVITDPGNPDGGTAFRPTGGYSYFQGLK